MKIKRCIKGLLSFLILTSSVINVKAEGNVNTWSFTNGAWHHFDEQGNTQTGLQEIDGNLYYLDGNGAMKTGWQYISNEWYYFHANGMAARNGWIGNYYLGSDGKMLRNQWVGGYYVDGNGAWVPSASEWRWIKENNIWKYHSTRTDQNLSNAWSYINGAWYHFDAQGNMQTGLQEIDGNLYYLDGNGAMRTGWQYAGEWYYFHANGIAARNGWVGNYYLGSDGKMLRNQWVGGYYVDGNGAWVPSASEWHWIKENNIWKYHSTRTGQNLSNAWSYINGAWYHFDTQGNMQTGLQEVDGNLYYLGGNGAMKTGWQYAGEWYYFHANGMAARNGWMGNYYLGSDGKMLRNQWVGNYYVDGNGACVPNASAWQWVKENNRWKYVNTRTGNFVKNQWMKTGSFWHYFDKDGYSVTGWQKIDGDDYCFDNNGAMLANTWSGDYYLNADGKMARNQWVGDYHVGADGKWDNVTPVYYSQRDPQWASVTYNGYSLHSTGCVPTSVAMAVNGFLHNGVNPKIMADYLVTTGEFAGRKHGGSGLAIKYGAEHWGLATTGIDSLATLVSRLDAGDIVVFQVGAGTFTSRGSTHAIVLFRNSGGSTQVYDPWNAHNGWYGIEMIWNQRSTNSYDLTGGYVGYGIHR